MHSEIRQNRSFYYVLAGMLALHAVFMLSKVADFGSTHVVSAPKAIKFKLVQQAIKDMTAIQTKQIVQSEDAADNTKPEKSAFLSDKDRRFDRETMARKVDTFKEAGSGNAAITQKTDKGSKGESKKKVDFKDLKLSDIGMKLNEPAAKEVSRAPASESLAGVKNGKNTTPGLSATNDYVEEVALGDFTHLNTVEYKFYGFFHRIRQKLEQFWGKSIQEKAEALFKAGRRLPASESLTTSLQVTLNAKGEIIGVKILGASGVRELDDAAIESFNQAGPFPNPPQDLLVNGKATIEWGFVVKS